MNNAPHFLKSNNLLLFKKKQLKRWVNRLQRHAKKIPILSIIQVGNVESSNRYITHKIKMCRYIGIKYRLLFFPAHVAEESLLSVISQQNTCPDVVGIIAQLPFPQHLNQNRILNQINYRKDVDGFSAHWKGRITHDPLRSVLPATVKGIIDLMHYYQINLAKRVVIIVNNTVVLGQPLCQYLIAHNVTTIVLNHTSPNLSFWTQQGDVIVSATGCKGLITSEMIKPSAILIDVGNCYWNNKLYGDFKIDDNLLNKCQLVTPVPGGVGPLTVISLLENLKQMYQWYCL